MGTEPLLRDPRHNSQTWVQTVATVAPRCPFIAGQTGTLAQRSRDCTIAPQGATCPSPPGPQLPVGTERGSSPPRDVASVVLRGPSSHVWNFEERLAFEVAYRRWERPSARAPLPGIRRTADQQSISMQRGHGHPRH
jgi:hypothetical protein